jgi:hypothetical protein
MVRSGDGDSQYRVNDTSGQRPYSKMHSDNPLPARHAYHTNEVPNFGDLGSRKASFACPQEVFEGMSSIGFICKFSPAMSRIT